MKRSSGASARDLRLVPFALVSWICAYIAISLPAASLPMALALWGAVGVVVCLCLCLRVSRGRGILALGAACLALAAVTVSHVALAQPGRTQLDAVGLGGGRAVAVLGQVTSKVEVTARGELRFDADTWQIEVGAQTTPVRVPVTITVARTSVTTPDGETLDLGSTVRAAGTTKRTDPPRRSVLLVFASRGVEVVRGPPWPLALAADTRTAFVERAATLPSPGGDLLPGLAVGDTRAVSTELDQAMKTSSLSHLTAVSGANCALVVGIAFGIAALGGAPRWGRVASGVAALAAFVVLVTPEPSVIRAAAMATIAMLAVLLGRTGAGIGVLSLAVTLLLAGDPWLAASLGFALSAAATAGLLVLSRPLATSLSRWMPRALALALSVPLAAQLACGPLLVLIAPQIPVYGVIANLLAAPAAPAATVVGLIACLIAAVPWLATPFMWIGWVAAAWISATATTFANLPFASAPWAEGVVGALALATAGGAIVWLLQRPRGPGRVHARLRGVTLLTIAALLGVAGGEALTRTVLAPALVPHDWAVAFCDVGQGDGIVVRVGEQTMLIDTGPQPPPLRACLDRLGIARIDLLVLTHFDLDHVGGAEAVLGMTDRVLHGPVAAASHRHLIEAFTAAGAEIREGAVGLGGALGDAHWRVLWPRVDGHAYREGNDASIVIEVDAPHLRAIFLGDLGAGAQRALLASGVLTGEYDLVKVSHHGSADQEPALYARLDPALAVFTVGAENTFGHPREEIMSELSRGGATLARTDESGLILVSPGGTDLRIWREERPTAREGELEGLPLDSD